MTASVHFKPHPPLRDQDSAKGAVECDTPDQPGHCNPDAPGALDEAGLPADEAKIREEGLSAFEDETTG